MNKLTKSIITLAVITTIAVSGTYWYLESNKQVDTSNWKDTNTQLDRLIYDDMHDCIAYADLSRAFSDGVGYKLISDWEVVDKRTTFEKMQFWKKNESQEFMIHFGNHNKFPDVVLICKPLATPQAKTNAVELLSKTANTPHLSNKPVHVK